MANTIKQTNLSDPTQIPKHGDTLPIGELLIKEGLVAKEDIKKALLIRKREQEICKLPLGQILVKTGALSETDLQDLLNHPDLKRHLGTLAVEKGLIDAEQLRSCLMNKSPNQLIGDFLVEQGFLKPEELEQLLREQISAPRLGELAVRLKFINEKDLNEALRVQNSPRTLEEILYSLNLLKPLDLNHVINKYSKQSDLGATLLGLGFISKENLDIAVEEGKSSSKPLEEILLRKTLITQEQLLLALSKQHNIPFEPLDEFAYSEDEKRTLVAIISQRYAEKNLILPISLVGQNLTIALCRPRDSMRTVHELKAMYSHLEISCVLIKEEKFEELFAVLYSDHLGSMKPSDSQEDDAEEAEVDFMELTLDEEFKEEEEPSAPYGIKDIEAEELVNFILKYGIINGASDIHIEQDRKGAKIRYRLDGVLRESNIKWLTDKLQDKASGVISRIKVMSNLDIAEKRLPQDGVFRINYYDKTRSDKFDLDFRVATCRAITGENVTIRILDPRKANVGLDNLNHSAHILEPLKTLLKSSAGMILVCGPTGSGKSSTLYAALQYVYSPSIKIITAEDPIEYNFPGIMQTQVNHKIQLTFAKLLRSFLRFDPDVIFVGEIRDEETAKIGFDGAQTGHLILSTIHTNDAIGAIPRLVDLEVEPGQISSCLMGVVAQRLVRRICPSCIDEYIPGDDEWGMFFKSYPAHLKFFKGRGCPECNFTGYKGRTLLSEILVIDSEVAYALNKGFDEKHIKRVAVESGMKTMLDDGLLKLNETTLSELIRMVPHDMIKEFRSRGLAQNEADLLVEQTLRGDGASGESVDQTASFQLSNPELEKATIDLMRAKYEALKRSDGVGSVEVDPLLFNEFITESFYQIRDQYHCKSVGFSIENNGGNGKTEISASPIS
jgi:type II secretory ATPase GspE/PulE/Tfp pilus assembly ATPase PilB-like protein